MSDCSYILVSVMSSGVNPLPALKTFCDVTCRVVSPIYLRDIACQSAGVPVPIVHPYLKQNNAVNIMFLLVKNSSTPFWGRARLKQAVKRIPALARKGVAFVQSYNEHEMTTNRSCIQRVRCSNFAKTCPDGSALMQ